MNKIAFLLILLITATSLLAENTAFETSTFKIALDAKGNLVSLFDKKNEKEYLNTSSVSALVSISVDGLVEQPSRMNLNGQIISLHYDRNNITAKVRVEKKPSHISFELIQLSDTNQVELVIWGPYDISISEIVGESVGVVRNSEFAIGIQALNVKTLGGYPTEESDIEPAYDIFATSDFVDLEEGWRLKRHYRGQTARLTENGSMLQAYTRNRSKDRIISNWGHNHYVAPAFNDGGVTGSKIALFGSPANKALETIGKIELAEGLPHPLIDGEWAKTARAATASYLIINFSEKNLDQTLELTKKTGLKYLYHGHPFQSWGHFPLLDEAFPDNWESMKRCVDRAKKEDIYLGVHTLTNFITTNDAYVTPVPDPRLARVGESIIVRDLDENSDEIFIESPLFFNQTQNNTLQAAMIGSEIIRYREVSQTEPWRLLACVRGAFDTEPSAHNKGTKIGKLMDHAYKVFLTDADLSEEIAITLARLFNETGLMQISFDGLEGVWSTGKGQYARALFAKTWYDHLNPELKGKVINDASNPNHFNWHINTRFNWGEPWYAGFRESQTQYRLMNQDFYRRNLLPSMLGWFSMNARTSIEDTEWLLARAAGFDAGFAFNLNLSHVAANGASNAIFATINAWETARMAGAFTPELKKRMEDINNEFHLETVGDGKWNVYQYHIQRFIHEQTIKQPGEPVHSIFEFDNPYDEQPVMFLMEVKPVANETTAGIGRITIELNNFSKLEFEVKMDQTHMLKLDNQGIITLYDKNWNVIETIAKNGKLPLVSKGKNRLLIDSEFVSEGNATLNVEMKTIGKPERIEAP